jgi:hypothetical protein
MWGYYGALSYEGRIMPYPDFIIRKEIEYDTRIYRLAMDATRTYVTRLAANGAGFPYTAPIANAFNFTSEGSETPFTTHSDQVSVSYRCMGFTCYNHILIFEFNEVVEEFNNDMRVENRERMMTKLKPWERDYFNRRSYPRINPATMELEWWVPNAVYNSGKSNIVRQSPVITK